MLDGVFYRCVWWIFIILHFYNTFNNISNTANTTANTAKLRRVEYLTIYLHLRQTLPSPCEFLFHTGTHSATVNQHPTSICTSHNSKAHLGSIFRDNSLHWYRFYLPITSKTHYEYVDHNANTGQNYTSFRSVRTVSVGVSCAVATAVVLVTLQATTRSFCRVFTTARSAAHCKKMQHDTPYYPPFYEWARMLELACGFGFSFSLHNSRQARTANHYECDTLLYDETFGWTIVYCIHNFKMILLHISHVLTMSFMNLFSKRPP